jgi:hypothetical protein
MTVRASDVPTRVYAAAPREPNSTVPTNDPTPDLRRSVHTVVSMSFERDAPNGGTFEDFAAEIDQTVAELHPEAGLTPVEWVLLEPGSNRNLDSAALSTLGHLLCLHVGNTEPRTMSLTYDPRAYTGTLTWQVPDRPGPETVDVVAVVGADRSDLLFHFSRMGIAHASCERGLVALGDDDASMLIALLCGDLEGSPAPGEVAALGALGLRDLLAATSAVRELTGSSRDAAASLAPVFAGHVNDLLDLISSAHQPAPA